MIYKLFSIALLFCVLGVIGCSKSGPRVTINSFLNDGWEVYEVEGRDCFTHGNSLKDQPNYTEGLTPNELVALADSDKFCTWYAKLRKPLPNL